MLVTFGNQVIGEIQGLSYTITREKAPLYTMGSANPRSFSRGKRGIAGSLIFLVFDRSAILETLGNQESSKYVGNEYEVRPDYDPQRITSTNTASQLGASSVGTPTRIGGVGLNEIGASKVLAKPQYHDQILPFNVSITAANEYGHVASMHILGIEIMNCGSGMSVDDITVDESCTFVCTDVIAWGNQKFIRGGIQDVSRRSESPKAGGGLI
jgi:hypothetical protein